MLKAVRHMTNTDFLRKSLWSFQQKNPITMQIVQSGFGFPQMMMALLMCLLGLVQPVEAKMSAGDIIALLIGLIIGFLGICACIGKYARGRA
jgi:hypothetical protein